MRIVWTILFACALKYMLFGTNRSLGDFVSKVMSGAIDGTYWFLYAYLGMILMLPFMRKMVAGLHKKEFIYVVGLHFLLLTALPMVQYISGAMGGPALSLSGHMSVPLMTLKALFYPFAGYALDHIFDVRSFGRKQWAAIILSAVGGIILSSAFTYHEGVRSGFTQNWVQLFDYLTAMAAFLIIKYLFTLPAVESKKALNTAICKLGGLAFGIYLLDPILKKFMYASVELALEPYLPTLIVSLIWCLLSMTIGGVLTYSLKMLPGLSKIL